MKDMFKYTDILKNDELPKWYKKTPEDELIIKEEKQRKAEEKKKALARKSEGFQVPTVSCADVSCDGDFGDCGSCTVMGGKKRRTRKNTIKRKRTTKKKTKKNKNTRKNQKGGDQLLPYVEEDFQFSLNKSIEKLFMTKQGNNYQLNLLDDDDYNDLVSLFKDGLKFRDKIVKPSPTYYYQDFSNITNSPRYNIVELLFTQNIDFSDFLQYLANNHPDLFDKIDNSRRMLYTASQYLSPTTEKLIEIFKEKEILNEVINPQGVTAYDRPILMLFSTDKNVIRLGVKENRQPRIIELMELFISHGANIDRKDISGYNALMLASDRGYEQVVSYLLSINFDINSKHERRNLAYITPLYLAIHKGHEDVVKILIEHKDPNNSISIEKLEEEAKDRNITLKMLELLGQEIENRKREALNDVVEQITGNDGTIVTDNIFPFVNDEWNTHQARYGGKTKKNKKTKKLRKKGKRKTKTLKKFLKVKSKNGHF